MGKILGIAIKNYGSLKDIKMGQLYSGQTGVPLGNMVAIIGPSGNGKSTLADAFGFIADALTTDVESACDASNRGGYDKLVSQGSNGPIHFEIYYKENSNSRPITYELTIGKDKYDRPYVKTKGCVNVDRETKVVGLYRSCTSSMEKGMHLKALKGGKTTKES